jgi:flagellar motor protein MotB
MLYSMSVINLAKFQKLAISVRSGSNGEMQTGKGMSIVEKGQVSTLDKPHSPEQIEQLAKGVAPIAKGHMGENSPFNGAMEGAEARLLDAEKALGGKGSVKITATPGGWMLELAGDEIFFDLDSAELTEAARAALLALAPSVGKAKHVQVEGYSSSSEVGGFELSSARALAVVEVLREGQVAEETLSATGFGVRAPGGLGGKDYVRIMLKR